MTDEEFYKAVGRYPYGDDLERANCQKAGQTGHQGCGICKKHGKPTFECTACWLEAIGETPHDRYIPRPN